MKRRAARALPWLFPPVLLVLLYWPAIGAWFQADDFAWLALGKTIHNWPSFLHAMFAPMAHGNIRPWSERGFFLLFHQLFGLNGVAWHAFVMANACACLLLLQYVTRRITGSALAGWIAPLVWTVSPAMPVALTWPSDYNQILCPLFFLAAFAFRLRRQPWWEFVVFVLGFGVLEINVVYPFIVAAWLLISRERTEGRRQWLPVAGMLSVTAAYLLVRSFFVRAPASGPYALHLDGSLATTFWQYWQWAWIGPRWTAILAEHAVWIPAMLVLLTVFCFLLLWKERHVALFGLAWFVLALLPFLPLRDHRSDYYLTLPSVGISLLVAAGVAAVSRQRAWRVPAWVILIFLLAANAFPARDTAVWWSTRGARVRTLVLGVATAHGKHPGKVILIDGLGEELYESAIAHYPFQLVDVPAVYLTPGTSDQLRVPSYLTPPEEFELPAGPALHALAEHHAVVYQAEDDYLQNITGEYARNTQGLFRAAFPSRVDVGNPAYAYLLGTGWFPLEENHRWMGQEASLHLAVPGGAKRTLVLSGYCPASFVAEGPLTLTVSIAGAQLIPARLQHAENPFLRTFPLPDTIPAANDAVITLRLNRTTTPPGDSRQLGLAFGSFEIGR